MQEKHFEFVFKADDASLYMKCFLFWVGVSGVHGNASDTRECKVEMSLRRLLNFQQLLALNQILK